MGGVQGFDNKDIQAFNYYEAMMVNGFAPKYVHFVLDDLLKENDYRIRILNSASIKKLYRICDNLHKHKKFSPMMQFLIQELQQDCPRFQERMNALKLYQATKVRLQKDKSIALLNKKSMQTICMFI